MLFANTPLRGSFQLGDRIFSHDPTNEAWQLFARCATSEFLDSTKSPVPDVWPQVRRYASSRIRQSLQFREASLKAGILTRPLLQYYCLLNAIRGGLALSTHSTPSKKHGLVLRPSENLATSSAAVTEGTFQEYLRLGKVELPNDTVISFDEALGYMPEMAKNLSATRHARSRCIQVNVQATTSSTRLWFDVSQFTLEDFRAKWSEMFPGLATTCVLASEGPCLSVRLEGESQTSADVSLFCTKHLVPHLLALDEPMWFALRKDERLLGLPMLAHYYVALFILGSVARYEPERLSDLADCNSETLWLVERFMALADRFVPQLLLNWLFTTTVYFV